MRAQRKPYRWTRSRFYYGVLMRRFHSEWWFVRTRLHRLTCPICRGRLLPWVRAQTAFGLILYALGFVTAFAIWHAHTHVLPLPRLGHQLAPGFAWQPPASYRGRGDITHGSVTCTNQETLLPCPQDSWVPGATPVQVYP